MGGILYYIPIEENPSPKEETFLSDSGQRTQGTSRNGEAVRLRAHPVTSALETALLYCTADSAKLCLLCDHHVHSANSLSRKHVRSQICVNCSSGPVTVQFITDNLLLCHDCNWDAHRTSSLFVSHHRTPVEGFTGCPSVSELASIWGFHFDDKKFKLGRSSSTVTPRPHWDDYGYNYNSRDLLMPAESLVLKSDGMSLQDLMVPDHNTAHCTALIFKKHIPSCGKHKHTYISRGNEEAFGLENGADDFLETAAVSQQPLQLQRAQQVTSLLMMPTQLDLKESDQVINLNTLWHSNPKGRQGVQIWDFRSGRLRCHEESGALEASYADSNGGFMTKSFGELIGESSLTNHTKVLEDLYGMNIAFNDMASYNANPSLTDFPTFYIC
ncbi:hypothetical protein L6164_015047 [Bauhinia variegata]|uniref:Uncharacterized protein n=1 Tax=Bauhinia variegata TaxID=167791 RepID=A0ACB9NKL9_BAUVA|nr:hypothetical protein L6164_015047 [Bauhinia variegata]